MTTEEAKPHLYCRSFCRYIGHHIIVNLALLHHIFPTFFTVVDISKLGHKARNDRVGDRLVKVL